MKIEYLCKKRDKFSQFNIAECFLFCDEPWIKTSSDTATCLSDGTVANFDDSDANIANVKAKVVIE